MEELVDIVSSKELRKLAYSEYSSFNLAMDASYASNITGDVSLERESISEKCTGYHKMASSLGPPKREERLAAQAAAISKDDLIKGAKSSMDRQICQGSTQMGGLAKIQDRNMNKEKQKLHVPYYYRFTKHDSATGMTSKYQTTQIPPNEKRKLFEKESKLKSNKYISGKTSAMKYSHPADHVMTPENASISKPLQKEKSTASVSSKTSKSTKHSKPKRISSNNDGSQSSYDQCCAVQYDVMFKSPTSVQTTKTYKGKSTPNKDAPSRAASTPDKRKKDKYVKKYDDTGTRKTESSKQSIFANTKERFLKLFGTKKNARLRNMDDMAPVDTLNIHMNKLTAQDVPCSVRGCGDSDPLPPMSRTPKREPAVGLHEKDTPISCLSMPILGHRDSCSSPSLKREKTKYKSGHENGEAFDMAWTNGMISGKYSGAIDESFNPHGKGVLKIKGVWEHGELVYHELYNSQSVVIHDPTHVPLTTAKSESNKCAPRPPLQHKSDASYHHNASTTSISENDLKQITVPVFSDSHSSSQLNKYSFQRSSTNSATSIHSASPASKRKVTNVKNHRDQQSVLSGFNTGSTTSRDHHSSESSKPIWTYHIGQVSRSPNHMIIHRSHFDAIDSVAMIKNLQQAFIKRSNGLWTCAVLVERGMQPVNSRRWYSDWEIDPDEMQLEESMLFVINGDGSTKIVNKRNWGKFVRRMKADLNNSIITGDAEMMSTEGGLDTVSKHLAEKHEEESPDTMKMTDPGNRFGAEQGVTNAHSPNREVVDNEEDSNIIMDSVSVCKSINLVESTTLDAPHGSSEELAKEERDGFDEGLITPASFNLDERKAKPMNQSTSTASSTLTMSYTQ